jgi:hypothetical protein
MLVARSQTLSMRSVLVAVSILSLATAHRASAQMAGMADHVMSGPMDANMMKHMQLTSLRVPTHEDSLRAARVATELRQAISRYRDTAIAVADGYKLFLPTVKTQKVYHFTSNRRALLSVFHFDASKPTSVLYTRDAGGKLRLIGAMYTMPRNASLGRLDGRVPLSIARWHKHVNWCLPRKNDAARFAEQQNGYPVFGPESPIDTKAGCDAVQGEFHPSVFGWMLHANVFDGTDLGTIFADERD